MRDNVADMSAFEREADLAQLGAGCRLL